MFCRIAAIVAVVWALTLTCSAFGQSSYDATFTQAGLGSMDYRVYLPADYDPAASQGIPVVLYLHSAAERGTSVNDIFTNNYPGYTWVNTWVDDLVAETQTGEHQAILVMPQAGWGEVWNSMNAGDNWTVGDYTDASQAPIGSRMQLAIDILTNTLSSYNTDANRVYVTGASMGGYGTWDALARFPELFAAGAPLSGGGNLTAAATTLADKPIWMYHGALDPLISVNNTDALYQTMTQAGGSPIYTRNPTAAHDGWEQFYTPDYYTTVTPSQNTGLGDGLYDWMFAQSLDQSTTITPPTTGPAPIVLDFAPGDTSNNTVIGYTADGLHLIVYNHMERANIANLNDINGNPTGISISHTGGTINHGGGVANPASPVDAIFPQVATSLGFYFFNSSPLVFTFSGMDDDATYTFEIFGGVDSSTLADITQYTLAGLTTQTGQLHVVGNTDTLLTFLDVHSLNGSVTLTLTVPSGVLGYINGLRIMQEPIPEPASLALLALGGIALLKRRNPPARS